MSNEHWMGTEWELVVHWIGSVFGCLLYVHHSNYLHNIPITCKSHLIAAVNQFLWTIQTVIKELEVFMIQILWWGTNMVSYDINICQRSIALCEANIPVSRHLHLVLYDKWEAQFSPLPLLLSIVVTFLPTSTNLHEGQLATKHSGDWECFPQDIRT